MKAYVIVIINKTTGTVVGADIWTKAPWEMYRPLSSELFCTTALEAKGFDTPGDAVHALCRTVKSTDHYAWLIPLLDAAHKHRPITGWE